MTSTRMSPLYLTGGNGLFGGMFNKSPPPPVDDDPEKGVPIFSIKLSSIKIGGLRIALALHCIGQTNTPDKNTWMANKAEDGVVEMWYNPDQSAMFSITLSETDGGSIEVDRHGPRPSNVYQLQEGLQLHKLLDELEFLAFGNPEDAEEEIKDEDRLLRLEEEDAIDKARKKLPARGA
eukprot:CAMPEP_0195518348 /NCGR_PEP_ID=MMETSP0794_2-20130614/12699_1 /TAXON_ID=515487 /ORGANISM="Stephanopyxis turris, Strain CCMP 815" /LENGTH=177 /DNA_ID=CAMNT_0040647297 /DNA_START=182 /DNA_END=715 /DNA_ORIENTATION=-